jgi:hypothetical protein
LKNLEIREKLETQKVIDKSEIINDNSAKYLWSIIIKKKKNNK